MKKKNLIFSAVGVGLLAAAMVGGFVHFQKQHTDRFLKVGIAVYDLEDPYIQTLTDAIRSQLKDKTIDGREIIYDVFDASGSAVTQNTQLYEILQQEYDVILWNPVSPTNVVGILEDAQEQDVPVILFNREPAKADLEEQDNVWYVGTEAKEAGNMQGEMLIQAWNTCEMDKNRNGMLDYILVEGEQAHTDVINRTDAFLQTASAALPLNQLHVISADWARTSALREMQNLSAEETTEVEAVICSNDSMALGVADFYAKQKLPLPVIIGINGIQDMQDAIDAQKEVIGNGEDQVILYAPEASQAFLDEVAARASGKPVEFFNAMPIAMCSKVRTAVQEAFAVKDQAKDGVVVLDKPYSFKGETVSEIDLSGVEELTSIDVSKAENEVLKTGIYSVNMKNFFAYSCALAARASGKPMEFFTGLPLHEAVKVRGTVNAASFFE